MSNLPTQRVRRNVSPASTSSSSAAGGSCSKQGPMKATVQFHSLMQQGSGVSGPTSSRAGPTNNAGRKVVVGSPSSSPTMASPWERVAKPPRRSPPDNHRSCGGTSSPAAATSGPAVESSSRSSSSPANVIKVERPKPLRSSPSNIKRTGSLDAIAGPYLTGQWPSFQNCQLVMTDKSTQTEDFEESVSEKVKKKHKRSASLYRQRLQRSKESSKSSSAQQRQSPIHGHHLALATANLIITTSKAIGIPVPHIPKTGVPRIRGSVEGLNQEIERLVLKNSHSGNDDIDLDRHIQEPTPDGHRAPVLELIRGGSGTRSIDTQTPCSGYVDHDSGTSSRSQSISPSFPPIIPGHMDLSRPSSRSSENTETETKEIESKGPISLSAEGDSPELISLPKHTISPRPNKSYSFGREPPDGCEKVNIITEPKRAPPVVKEPLLFNPLKQSQFVLKPSAGSAFCTLNQMCASGGGSTAGQSELAVKHPVTTQTQTTIESQ
ncbi:protein FAM117B-like isoform X2 [Tubulanus polymorphus]|uniref:protein FAM117B-like isoform X2 n=1 Tax=Tubulanus polymorphus TaxID=672921 RepID=UPI003DA4E36A